MRTRVRFIWAGVAPYAAGRLVSAFNIHVPFLIGAAAIVAGIVLLAGGHRQRQVREGDVIR